MSWEALSRIVLTGIFLFLAWQALGVVVDIIVALVLAASFYPFVHKVHEQTKLPVFICAIILFLLFLVPFLIVGFTVVPNLSTQLPQLFAAIDTVLGRVPFAASILKDFSITGYMQAHSVEILASSGNILLTFFSLFSTLILTFYFIYDYERLLSLFLNIFPYREKQKLRGFLEEIAKVMGQYIRGNLIISFITFCVIFIGLLIFQIPFALPLALFAGIVDLLPLVGSTLGAIPALLVAFGLSPAQGFSVLLLHFVYQQTENAIISPAIYNKALNLYPSLGFLAVLLGTSLFGFVGAFLALPVAASIPSVVEYHKNYRQRHSTLENGSL